MLAEVGYNESTSHGIVRFKSDYVYDEDENHPESHKTGEVRVYDIYTKNSEVYFDGMYAMPTIYEAARWILDNLYLNITVIRKNGRFSYDVIDFDGKSVLETSNVNDNYEYAYVDGIITAIEEHNKNPHRTCFSMA